MSSTINVKKILIVSILTWGVVLIGLTLPVFMLIAAAPLLLLSYENGPRQASLAAVVSVLMLFFVLPPQSTLSILVAFAPFAIASGSFARKTASAGVLLGYAVIFSTLSKLLLALLVFHQTGENAFASPGTKEAIGAMLENMGRLSGNAQLMPNEKTVDAVFNLVRLFLPFALLFSSFVEAFFCLSLASAVHKFRKGERFFQLPPFATWRFPRSLFFALLVGFGCQLLASGNQAYGTLGQIGANILLVVRTFFIVQGFSVAYFFLEKRRVPKFFRVSIIIISLMVQFLLEVFALVGILDIGFDLRKRIKGNE